MQVGVSTASFYNTCVLEDAPARIASIGASLAEVFLNTFSEYEDDFILLLKDRILEEKLSIYSVHPMGTQFEAQLFSMHPRQQADAFKIFEQVLRAGKLLNAQYYVMHGPAGHYGTIKNMHLDQIGPVTHDLCALASEYGIKIAWENVSWCMFSEPDFGMRLMDAAKTNDLRFTMDIKQAVRSGYTPFDYIHAMREYCVNLHVCDYAFQNGNVVPMLPGYGECNLLAIKEALLKYNYTGPAFLEVYSDLYKSDEELQKSYRWICSQLN
ncbi:sugar phosphate isomerase/epimerase [Christensenellaceae bacterium OttesenSCG-928-M15]|nr:sugar phosphate isomerase/epimerase [Christensenellaceae bacterium OttesenSCG-928-M15]